MTTENIEKVAGRITAGLTEASERILSLAAKIKEAKDEIPADQLKELGDITKLLSELTQRYPSPKAKAGVEKGAEAEFVPKAIRERYNAIDGRLAAARQNGTTTTSQATGVTDPAGGTAAPASGTQAASAGSQTPPPAATAGAGTDGHGVDTDDDGEVEWPYDMAATMTMTEPTKETPPQTKPKTETNQSADAGK